MIYKLKLLHQWQKLHIVFNVMKLIAAPKDPIPEWKTIVIPVLSVRIMNVGLNYFIFLIFNFLSILFFYFETRVRV